MRRDFDSLVRNASIGPAFLGAILSAAVTSLGSEPLKLWSIVPLAFPTALGFTYLSSGPYEFKRGVDFQSPASEWLSPTLVFFIAVPLYMIPAALLSLPVLFVIEEVVWLSDIEYWHTAQLVAVAIGYLPAIYYWLKLNRTDSKKA